MCLLILVICSFFRLAKEWRKSHEAPLEAPTPEEVDLDIKETKDFNRLLMSKLGEVAEQHPEIDNRFQQLCEEVTGCGKGFDSL